MRGRGRVRAAAAGLLLLAAAPPVGETERVRWLGEMRHFVVHRPATAGRGAPLLVVLGEPGRSGRYAVASWRELADLEGLVVAGVSSAGARAWREAADGCGFVRAVVRAVAGRHAVDRRRVYLFGAGSGGGFALSVAARQPRFFAAVASFGGGLASGELGRAQRLERALPVAIFYPKHTPQFDLEALQQTAGALRESGAEVELARLDVRADFERRGHKVAPRIWAALSGHALSEEPRYRPTAYDR